MIHVHAKLLKTYVYLCPCQRCQPICLQGPAPTASFIPPRCWVPEAFVLSLSRGSSASVCRNPPPSPKDIFAKRFDELNSQKQYSQTFSSKWVDSLRSLPSRCSRVSTFLFKGLHDSVAFSNI